MSKVRQDEQRDNDTFMLLRVHQHKKSREKNDSDLLLRVKWDKKRRERRRA